MKVNTAFKGGHRLSAAEISNMLADRIDALARDLLSAGYHDTRTDEWAIGDAAGTPPKPKRGSCRVHLSGDFQGKWRDFSTGQRGDALDLVAQANGLTINEAMTWAKAWLGIQGEIPPSCPAPTPRPRVEPQEEVERRHREMARAMWRDAKPASETFVQTYLVRRGITLPPPPSLRFVPAQKHTDTSLYFPVMLAAVQSPSGEIVAVHRTFLAIDGTKKASVSRPKMMLGPCMGNAVRLGPVAPRLAVTEGIENALSVAQSHPGLSVWSALSACGMEKIILPPEVREVILCADRGERGESAARQAAKRFIEEKRVAKIVLPPEPHDDFNDVLMAQTRCPVEIVNAR